MDLTDEQIDAALVSREKATELLTEMTGAAKPGEGASKILLVLAHAARARCAWLGGPLMVQVSPVGDKTEIRVAYDRGGGVLVAIFSKMVLDAPFEEFARSLKVAPRAVEPLRVFAQDGRIVLAPNKRMSIAAMPALPRKSPVLDFSALEGGDKKKD